MKFQRRALRNSCVTDPHRTKAVIWDRSHTENRLWHPPGLRWFACVGRAPHPVTNLRQVLAVFVDVVLVLDQLVLELLLQVDALVASLRQAVDVGTSIAKTFAVRTGVTRGWRRRLERQLDGENKAQETGPELRSTADFGSSSTIKTLTFGSYNQTAAVPGTD